MNFVYQMKNSKIARILILESLFVYMIKINIKKLVFMLPSVSNISIILFALVLLGAILSQRENVISYFAQAGLVMLVLNIVMMTFGYFIAKLFASGIKQRKCISIECGLQNGTLAIFVASQIFNDISYVIPTAAYALIMYLTGFIFILILRRAN